MFYDTDRFDLYRNNFILRKRTFRARDHSTRQELAFKFRHPDSRLAAGVDPRPAVEIPYLIRFKEQVLPAQWGERGTRSLFWHGCKIFERCELENTRYRAAADTFPVLRRLGVDPDARLRMVNGTVVNESLCEIGRLKFA